MRSKRKRFAVIALLLLFFSIIGLYITLKSGEEYVPENTVSAYDNKRSQVFVSGDKYTLNKETKKEHKKNEQKRSDILDQEDAGNNSDRAIASDGGDSVDGDGDGDPDGDGRIAPSSRTNIKDPGDMNKRPGDNDDKPTDDPEDPDDATDNANKDDDEESYYKSSEEERKLKPTIKTSLVTGQRFSGKTVSFWVTATDYKKQNIPAGTKSNGDGYFKVLINGIRTISSGSNGVKTNFRPGVKNGKNTIKIIAVDRRGKDRTITRTIRCNTKKAAPKNMSLFLTISAKSIHLDLGVNDMEVKFARGDTLSEVLDSAIRQLGWQPIWNSNSKIELQGIKKKGIAKKAYVDDETRAKGKSLTYKDEYTPNSIKKGRYYAGISGWKYKVDGIIESHSFANVIADEGMDVYLWFHLFDGDGFG